MRKKGPTEQKQNRQRRPLWLRILLGIVLLPLQLPFFVLSLAGHVLLVVATLLLCLYMAVTTIVTGPLVSDLLSKQLAGRFQIRYLAWNPLSDAIQAFDVSIEHPNGTRLIHADHLSASFNLQRLAIWGAGAALGMERPVPIHFPEVAVEDFDVRLEFDRGTLSLVDAFQPVVPPSDDTPGIQPHVLLERIVVRNGKTDLLFDVWSMDVAVKRAEALVEVKDKKPFVQAWDVNVPSFLLLGALLPPNVRFLGTQRSEVHVPSFRLTERYLEVLSAKIQHPDLKAQVDFQLFYQDPEMPVDCRGEFRILNPERMLDTTLGNVKAAPSGSVRMFGSIKRPSFEGLVYAPLLEVADLVLEHLEADVLVKVVNGVEVQVRSAQATSFGRRVEVESARFRLDLLQHSRVSATACINSVPIFEVLDWLRLSDLALPLDDGATVDVCAEEVDVTLPPDDITVSGNVQLRLYPGNPLQQLGIPWLDAEAHLDFSPKRIRLESLLVGDENWDVHGDAELSLAGPSPSVSALAGFHVTDLGLLAGLAQLGISGPVALPRVEVSGPVSKPDMDVELEGQDLRVLGETVESLRIHAVYRESQLSLPEFCVQSGNNQGCLVAELAADPLAGNLSSWPLSLEWNESLSLDLSALPLPGFPLGGRLTLPSGRLRATLETDIQAVLASLQGELSFVLAGLNSPWIQMEAASGKLAKGLTSPESPLGVLEAQVDWTGLTASQVSVSTGSLQAHLHRFSGLRREALLPDLDGDLLVAAQNLRLGDIELAKVQLEVSSQAEPSLWKTNGNVRFRKGTQLDFRGELDGSTWLAQLGVSFAKMAVLGIPGIQDSPAASNLAPTKATGEIRLTGIPVLDFLDGRWERGFVRLSGSVQLSLREFANLPEPVQSLDLTARLSRGKVQVSNLRVGLGSGITVSLSGQVDPLKQVFNVDLTIPPLVLDSLATVRALHLPLSATVEARLHLSGPWVTPEVRGEVGISGLNVLTYELGDAALSVEGRVGERIVFKPNSFFPGLSMKEGDLAFRGGLPVHANLDFGFSELDVRRFVTQIPEQLQIVATGTAAIHVDLAGGRPPFLLTVALPGKQTSLCTSASGERLCFANTQDAYVAVTDRKVTIQGLTMEGAGQRLGASGDIDFASGYNLDLSLDVDVAAISQLSDVLASYSGHVTTGHGGLKLTGDLDSPFLDGSVALVDFSVFARGFDSEISIDQGEIRLRGNLARGNVLALLPEDAPIVGAIDDGKFRIHGWFRIGDWKPMSGLLYVEGQDVFYQSPREFKVVVSPRVEIAVNDLWDAENSTASVSGEVVVSEGEFTRNFDRLLGSFATAFSRSQQRYSRPITEILPFLKRTSINLDVRGGNFNVSSKFPFGETELTVDLDLRIGGTVENLRIWDRMRVVPGGAITYKVVKRVFEVTQGSVDFSGNPSEPYMDIKARTEVLYKAPDDYATSWSLEEKEWGKPVVIEIHITGVYPNIQFELTSDSPEFDQADLQTLLLLGMTRRDLEGRQQSGSSDVSINVLTDDVAGLVSELILAPFVDAMSLGFTREGGIRAEAETRIGRAMNLTTRVRQDSTRSEYSAGFQFKITDRLVLEGKMKMIQEESESLRNYEAKFRYTIPLE